MKSTASQRSAILALLLQGNSLTSLDALNYVGCFRLAARISELRNQFNYPIKGRWVTSGEKRFMEYYIDEKDIADIKRTIRENSREAVAGV